MCRNIRVLHHFAPPTTDEEIRAAALQFVRKVSGQQAPRVGDREIFEQAIDAIAAQTKALLSTLGSSGPPRTREGEKEKGRLRWKQREARLTRG